METVAAGWATGARIARGVMVGALFRLIFRTAEVFRIALLCFDWPPSRSVMNMMEVPPCKKKKKKNHPSLQGSDFSFQTLMRSSLSSHETVSTWKNVTASLFRLVFAAVSLYFCLEKLPLKESAEHLPLSKCSMSVKVKSE